MEKETLEQKAKRQAKELLDRNKEMIPFRISYKKDDLSAEELELMRQYIENQGYKATTGGDTDNYDLMVSEIITTNEDEIGGYF